MLLARLKRHFNLVMYPRYINLITTYKCNSRCMMCGIWRLDRKRELTISDINQFLNKNKRFLRKVRHIGLTGGEPTMREDLVKIVRTIRNYLPNTATGFQTNGLMPEKTKRIAKKILEFYPGFSISVSLDGLGAVHDKIRGRDGAYEKALRTMTYMMELGIPRTVGMTITLDNYRQIGAVRHLAESMGYKFSCFLADKSWYFNNENADRNLPPLNLIDFPSSYYMSGIGINRKFTCYGGFTTLTIDPYGNVYPCILKKIKFGNIKERKLSSMLYDFWGDEVKKEVKKCRGCWSQCEVTTSGIIDKLDVLKWFISCKAKRRFLHELKK